VEEDVQETATYKKLAHYGMTVRNELFSSSFISSQMEMANDGQEKDDAEMN